MRNGRSLDRRAAIAAGSVGGVAGFAALAAHGVGLMLGVATVALAMSVVARRGRQRELPLTLLVAGLVPALILSRAMTNADPAVTYAPATWPALAVAVAVVAAGAVWTLSTGRRGSHH